MKSLFFIFLLAVGCDSAVDMTREYIYISVKYNWHHAQWYCRIKYKDLATISNMEEKTRLLESGPGTFGSFIGLQKGTSGKWTWSDGEPLYFPNWFSNVSLSLDYTYNCTVTGSTYSGFKVNYMCSMERSFYCYRFLILVKENKTWDEAQRYCKAHYTGLASVTSEVSLEQVNVEAAETQTESVWTGLRFMNGIWFWVSREQLGSLVSMPSCTAPPYRCGALNTTTNTLTDQHCNQKLNFICYWV